jgi:hypothetical protein
MIQKIKKPYSRLEVNQYRLRQISLDLETSQLSHADRKFLILALRDIGAGKDSNVALGVSAKRGQRKTSGEAFRAFKMKLAMSWIATAILPERDGGLGYTVTEAIAQAAEPRRGEANFGLAEDSLRTYWNNHPELRKPQFQAPISVLPIRD